MLNEIVNPEERQLYQFFIDEKEVKTSIKDLLEKLGSNKKYN